jgi:hypothetical protein
LYVDVGTVALYKNEYFIEAILQYRKTVRLLWFVASGEGSQVFMGDKKFYKN